MFTQLSLWQYAAITVLGIVAGVINILAGGGSNLILPLLMLFGIPPEIANGSNRIGIFLQTLTGIRGFAKAGKLPRTGIGGIIVPTFLGGIAGALLAAWLPGVWLKPALLLTMLLVAAVVFFKPDLLTRPADQAPKSISESKAAWLALFGAGVYGGFVQAGVGLLMLTVFAGMLHYDAVRSNALKLLCTLGFTAVALLVFLLHGQVWWDIGLALALGNMAGAAIGVKTALKLSPKLLRWGVFTMTLTAVAAALIH